MSLLKEATVQQSAAKVGIFGRQGSGKTTTAMFIALGLSKTYHAGAPIAMLDTENGSDYLVEVAAAEGVKLLVIKSRAFTDMREGLKEAQGQGCCAYLVDSVTHPWQELIQSFKNKSRRKRLEFHHMDELKSTWRTFTDAYLNSPLHVILAGRLGFEWGEEEQEDGGEKKLVKLGTKLKSESEAGYEPSLLIELEGMQDSDKRLKTTRMKKGTIVHYAYVLKDRWRSLNGRTFQFPDVNEYHAGDYKAVFTAFAPHWSKLAIGGVQQAVDASRTSEALFDHQGDSAYQQRVRRVQIVLEELEGTLVALWPGQDAKSKELKRLAIETLFGTRSWTAVSSKPLEALDLALRTLKLFETQAKTGTGEALTEPLACSGLLAICAAKQAEDQQTAEDTVGIL